MNRRGDVSTNFCGYRAEVDGDKSKRISRYVELRAEQLYAEATGTLDGAAGEDQQALDFDVNGTFVGRVSPRGSLNGRERKYYSSMFPIDGGIEIKLKQVDDTVTGNFSHDSAAKIEGSVEDGKVRVIWYNAGCGDGSGEWDVQEGGWKLVGTWKCRQYGLDGDWVLDRF